MSLIALESKQRSCKKLLFDLELVKKGISFREYMINMGSGAIFNTSTCQDNNDVLGGFGKENLKLVTVSGITSFKYPFSPKFSNTGLGLCPYEVAFEILGKDNLLNSLLDCYLVTKEGIFILSKSPIFIALSWLKSDWQKPELGKNWVFSKVNN